MGRLELGRELPRRVGPGLLLALDAVRRLAVTPLLAVSAFAAPFGLPEPPALASVLLADVLGLDRADVRPLAVVALAALAALPDADLEDEAARAGRPALPDADLEDEAGRAGRPEPVRLALAGAGWAGPAGLAADSVFAAVVRALAAVDMALVAVFMDCIAVDIVFADEVARVAAAVILVAAEVTLVAADETVLAAVAGVGVELAEELRVLRPVPVRVADRVAVARVLRPAAPLELRVLRAAVLPVLRAAVLRAAVLPVLRADLAAVLRVDGLAPVARAVALVVGRPADRVEPLVLIDRVLLELAGLRREVARAVVCTGTDFPPS